MNLSEQLHEAVRSKQLEGEMNINQVNSVLYKAILGFQSSEIEAISEAAIGGYTVPSPGQVGGFKLKSPSDFGVEPKKHSVKKSSRWAKGQFQKKMSPTGSKYDVEITTIPGYTKGVWGVSQDGESPGWSIFHIPSGRYVTTVRTKKSATGIIDAVIDDMPSIENERDMSVVAIREVWSIFQSAIKAFGGSKKKASSGKAPPPSSPLSMAGTTKWKKGKFEITYPPFAARKEPLTKIESGYTKGVWAIQNEGRKTWGVWHVPLAASFAHSFKSWKEASKFMDYVLSQKPSLLNEKSKSKLVNKEILRIRAEAYKHIR